MSTKTPMYANHIEYMKNILKKRARVNTVLINTRQINFDNPLYYHLKTFFKL